MHQGKFKLLLFLPLILLFSFTSLSCSRQKKEEVKAEEIEKFVYDRPEICGGCHEKKFKEWEGAMHSVAFIDPLYWKEVEMAGKEAGEKIRNFCHSCHSPVGILRKEILKNADEASEIAKKGVFCDFCHTIKGMKSIGNASYEPDSGRVKRGPLKDAESPFHETAYSELYAKSEFCGMCHDVTHPVNGLPIERTYSEWKKGPYAKEGIQCQDCHLTPGPGPAKPEKGVVATYGPVRENVYHHLAVGGNTLMTKYLGLNGAYAKAVERLKYAAKIEIQNPGKLKEGVNKIKVKVTNKGAGHYLPTGLTEMREMWIYLEVKDVNGKEIFTSGKLDKEGNVDPRAVIYHTVLGDEKGRQTVKVWKAEKILYDRRIPPKESVIESYEIEIPPQAKPPFKIKAVLYYRSASQKIVNELFGKAGETPKIEVPVIEMTSHAITVP
jgi:hypothetical protein